MIYLYNYAGQPWKAQYWIREVMERMYTPLPDGYCGDEDNGQTSAWYVFSALGFYPVCPGSGQYVVGTPYFDHVTLHLENGKQVTIDAQNNAINHPYIQSLNYDGKPFTRNYFTHEELLKGAKLEYSMSATPNKQRGIDAADAPYSFSQELKQAK